MPPKKRPPSVDTSRLKILAAGDEPPFAALVREMLASGVRLQREAALEALLARPLPALRGELRNLYFDLDADGSKRDQGCAMRSAIVQLLDQTADLRDSDIAFRAAATFEKILADDVSWRLRTYGLRMIARVSPEHFGYIAAEHLNSDYDEHPDVLDAVISLLAATGKQAQIYQWLKTGTRPPEQVAAAFEVLAGAPQEIVERYAKEVIRIALASENDRLALAVAETIIEREMESLYGAIERLLAAKISDELYAYITVLMASTNRPALLAILEQQLHSGRRPRLVVEALRIRTTPEQAAILKRWEDGDQLDR